MAAPWLKRLGDGLSRSRDQLKGNINAVLGRGPAVDDQFWEDLEEALIASDMGVTVATDIVERLKLRANADALPDANAVVDRLADEIAAEFASGDDFLNDAPVCVLVVGVNGSGKTTTIGKLSKQAVENRCSVLLGAADTFRAAAGEQLDIWAERAGVPVVTAERGTDPASVAFDTVVRAEETSTDLALIDTAGRLHTSVDLMRELEKVARVVKKRASMPVRTLLVLDATTGQNGLAQAREFNQALEVDGIALTKLDGTAKGGITVAISRELGLPILRIGVGEGIDDLHAFDAAEFARALVSGTA